MMLASSRAMAKRSPARRETYVPSPAATPPASVKFPNPGCPAKTAAEKPNMAAAPTTTIPIPIHRSARS